MPVIDIKPEKIFRFGWRQNGSLSAQLNTRVSPHCFTFYVEQEPGRSACFLLPVNEARVLAEHILEEIQALN
jgi:hypothetical protein